MHSPLFAVSTKGLIHKLQVSHKDGGRIAFEFVQQTQPDLYMTSAKVVEDYYISEAPVTHHDLGRVSHGPTTSERDAQALAISILISRTAVEIPRRNRRGAGNIAMMHPSVAQLIQDCAFAHTVAAGDGAYSAGRWTHAGKLNQTMDVWTADDCPVDTIVVVYRGSNEGDGIAVLEDANGFGVFKPVNDLDIHCLVIKLENLTCE